MANLYDLTSDLLQLMAMAEDPDADEQAIKDTMEAVEGEFEMKAEGYAKVIKSLEADVEAFAKEKKRLEARKKTIENNIARIKKNLESAMISVNKPKFKSGLFGFYIQKNPPSLKVNEDIDFDKVPAEYIIFPEPELNNDLVKKAIQEGKKFDFAHIEQGESLRIR